MLFQACLLFFATLLGGMMVLVIASPSAVRFKLILLFAGGYLFSSTLLHLFPALFAMHPVPTKVGLYILIGFFLQSCLELFSKGIEHGHMNETKQAGCQHKFSSLTLLISIFIHAFLDGTILSRPTSCARGTDSLLLGIVLHKALEAFALVSVLVTYLKRKRAVIVYLVLFALVSPLGLWISGYCNQHFLLAKQGFNSLSAIVSGNFLHISTTILFESSPNHHFNTQKVIASLAGASLAALLELL